MCCGTELWLLLCVVGENYGYCVVERIVVFVTMCCGRELRLCVVGENYGYYVLWERITVIMCCGRELRLLCVVGENLTMNVNVFLYVQINTHNM